MSDELLMSEIEVKFGCNELELSEFITFIAEKFPYTTEQYHKVAGWDTYYGQGNNVVRHRCDGGRKRSILTVKRRKSAESLTDRHEIDMPVGDDVSPEVVTAFLKMTGWKKSFKINKESFIFHLNGADVHVCIALYDVWRENEDRALAARRFLEIEIEKDSKLTIEGARALLEEWKAMFQSAFGFDEPLNESLYEMYNPVTP